MTTPMVISIARLSREGTWNARPLAPAAGNLPYLLVTIGTSRPDTEGVSLQPVYSEAKIRPEIPKKNGIYFKEILKLRLFSIDSKYGCSKQ
jgi:hypothetical protein